MRVDVGEELPLALFVAGGGDGVVLVGVKDASGELRPLAGEQVGRGTHLAVECRQAGLTSRVVLGIGLAPCSTMRSNPWCWRMYLKKFF